MTPISFLRAAIVGREQGWRGAVVRALPSHQCGPGSTSRLGVKERKGALFKCLLVLALEQ